MWTGKRLNSTALEAERSTSPRASLGDTVTYISKNLREWTQLLAMHRFGRTSLRRILQRSNGALLRRASTSLRSRLVGRSHSDLLPAWTTLERDLRTLLRGSGQSRDMVMIPPPPGQSHVKPIRILTAQRRLPQKLNLTQACQVQSRPLPKHHWPVQLV